MKETKFPFPYMVAPHEQIIYQSDSGVTVAIGFIMCFVLLERFLVQLGAPGSIIYIIDIVNVYLLIRIIYQQKLNRLWVLLVCYVLLIFSSIIVALPHYAAWGGNPIFTLIEVRNIVRFFIFFVACAAFLKKEKVEQIFWILTAFYYINSVYIIYQYFTFHPANTWMRGDLLNGFFGTETGGNTFVNVLMLVVISFLFNIWAEGKIRFFEVIVPLLLSITIAGMIELKAYFVEVAVIYVWYLVRTKKNYKELSWNILMIFALVAAAYIALQYMYMEYPWFRDTMSLKGMINSITDSGGYTGEQDLNRLTGIVTISKDIFHGELAEIMFGIGIGNAATYSLGGVSTLFSELFASNHYAWFSGTYVFVQCGIFGIVVYLFMFCYLLFRKKCMKAFRLVTEVMAIMAIFLFFYGEALKTDAGYFVYFALASGFIIQKQGSWNNEGI